MAVGLHAARRSGVRDGDRVVLIGAGAIGTFVLTALGALAEVDLTVIDLPGSRLERATRLGATRVVDAGVETSDGPRHSGVPPTWSSRRAAPPASSTRPSRC